MPPRQTRPLPEPPTRHHRRIIPLVEGPAIAPSSTIKAAASTSSSTSTVATSSAATWAPPRGQSVTSYARGSKRAALQLAECPALVAAAAIELKDRIYSKTNRSTLENKLDTWIQVATKAGYTDPFALNVDMIYSVAAVLWKANYRSIDTYLSVARQEMILTHGSLPEPMAIHFKRISRAAARGRGPAKQASEFPFERLQELDDSESALVRGGPCHSKRLAIIASWWMLREIEITNLTSDCVTLTEDTAQLRLPASKTDQVKAPHGLWRALAAPWQSHFALFTP